MQGKRDRATRVTRQYIPQGNGHERPLGIPAVEDKRRQRAVAGLLEAIDEQDFRRCRDGYRPHVGAWDAVDTLTITLPCGQYHVVVAADSKGFCDNIPHDGRIRRWEERLEDGA